MSTHEHLFMAEFGVPFELPPVIVMMSQYQGSGRKIEETHILVLIQVRSRNIVRGTETI